MAYNTSVTTQFNIYAVPAKEYARLCKADEIDEDALYLVADEVDPDTLPKLGIADIQQTVASDVEGGANTITITLSDGSKKEFTLYNFKGEPGASGSVTADSVTAALGYVPAKQSGVYELIETINIAEDGIATIARTAAPDGTAYNFSRVHIKIVMAAAAGSASLNFAWGNFYLTIPYAFHTSVCYSTIDVWVEHGKITGQCVYGMGSPYAASQTYSPAYLRTMISCDCINSIRLTPTGNNNFDSFPVGSAIEIWGVRA